MSEPISFEIINLKGDRLLSSNVPQDIDIPRREMDVRT